MLDLLEKRYKIVVIVILAIILISFFNLIGTDRDYNLVEGIVIDLISPVFSGIDSLKNTVETNWQVVVDFKNVKEENQRLKEEIATLHYNQNKLEAVMEQNSRLRDLLNFEQREEHQVVGASVIGYNTSNWSNTVLINRGRNDGVEQGMPIVAQDGYLVGIIQRTSRNNSQVTLLNDMNFITSGTVQRSRELGVIRGQVKFDRLLMDNLEWDAQIEVGDVILTSGLSRNHPKGIPVGKVTSVFADDYGLSQAAYIQPFAKLDKLEEVLVISNYNPEFKDDELIEDDQLLDQDKVID